MLGSLFFDPPLESKPLLVYRQQPYRLIQFLLFRWSLVGVIPALLIFRPRAMFAFTFAAGSLVYCPLRLFARSFCWRFGVWRGPVRSTVTEIKAEGDGWDCVPQALKQLFPEPRSSHSRKIPKLRCIGFSSPSTKILVCFCLHATKAQYDDGEKASCQIQTNLLYTNN